MGELCHSLREQLPELLHGELSDSDGDAVRRHLEGCEECREVAELMAAIDGTLAVARDALTPPPGLRERLTRSPCERWLGLMFQAVDRTLPENGLERLVGHLESCPACHRAWDDMTLIHQVADALEPPPHLAAACADVRRRPVRRRAVIGRRFATAAAYVLAVLTSFALGNPVTTARMPSSDAVQRVAATVSSEVGEVAADGRGELKVMLWRTLRWAEERAEEIRDLLGLEADAGRPEDEIIELRHREETP